MAVKIQNIDTTSKVISLNKATRYGFRIGEYNFKINMVL